MKLNLIVLLLLTSFATHGMQKLATLPILPASEDELMNFPEIPNSQLSAPIKPLKLWQSAEDKAHHDLQLATARVELLEQKYVKVKRAYDTKKEKALDNLVYAAGYMAIPIAMDNIDSPIGIFPLVFGAAPREIFGNLRYTLGYSLYETFKDSKKLDWQYLFYYAGIALAIKSAVQAGLEYRKLPTKPEEPIELIEARKKRDELLLLTHQPLPLAAPAEADGSCIVM